MSLSLFPLNKILNAIYFQACSQYHIRFHWITKILSSCHKYLLRGYHPQQSMPTISLQGHTFRLGLLFWILDVWSVKNGGFGNHFISLQTRKRIVVGYMCLRSYPKIMGGCMGPLGTPKQVGPCTTSGRNACSARLTNLTRSYDYHFREFQAMDLMFRDLEIDKS